jgi:cyanate permease
MAGPAIHVLSSQQRRGCPAQVFSPETRPGMTNSTETDQAVALSIIINSRNDAVLIGCCALFGFSVGNLITLPSLIVQREFAPRLFGVLISLITAINQVTFAFGPGIVGLLRDASGSYSLPFYGCIGLELIAAVLIMARGRKGKAGN